MKRIGKPNASYLQEKAFFLNQVSNRNLLEKAKKASAKYAQQPERSGCVVCLRKIEQPIFKYLGVEYCICNDCGHLNGIYEDTPEFARFLYEQDNVDSVVSLFDDSQETFMARVDSVYKPKAEFLSKALKEQGEDPSSMRYVDLGAGSGHFVLGMHESGLANAVGYDASSTMVDRTNALFEKEVLKHNKIEDIAELARTVEAEVVTMIFSLEHILGLRNFMSSLSQNKSVRYFFFAVPLYTPSVLIDVAFPDLSPRTIGLGHTHLFSEKSIEKMCADVGMSKIAEWWFGGNAFDLIRNIALNLQSGQNSAEAADAWLCQMADIIDDVQLVFDNKQMSSEIHLLVKTGS